MAKKFLEITIEIFGENDPHVADALNGLASVYVAKGDYGLAEPLYQRALEIEKEGSVSFAVSLNNVAWLYKITHRLMRRGCLKSLAGIIVARVAGREDAPTWTRMCGGRRDCGTSRHLV